MSFNPTAPAYSQGELREVTHNTLYIKELYISHILI